MYSSSERKASRRSEGKQGLNCKREEGRKLQVKAMQEQRQREGPCAAFPGQSTDCLGE